MVLGQQDIHGQNNEKPPRQRTYPLYKINPKWNTGLNVKHRTTGIVCVILLCRACIFYTSKVWGNLGPKALGDIIPSSRAHFLSLPRPGNAHRAPDVSLVTVTIVDVTAVIVWAPASTVLGLVDT